MKKRVHLKPLRHGKNWRGEHPTTRCGKSPYSARFPSTVDLSLDEFVKLTDHCRSCANRMREAARRELF